MSNILKIHFPEVSDVVDLMKVRSSFTVTNKLKVTIDKLRKLVANPQFDKGAKLFKNLFETQFVNCVNFDGFGALRSQFLDDILPGIYISGVIEKFLDVWDTADNAVVMSFFHYYRCGYYDGKVSPPTGCNDAYGDVNFSFRRRWPYHTPTSIIPSTIYAHVFEDCDSRRVTGVIKRIASNGVTIAPVEKIKPTVVILTYNADHTKVAMCNHFRDNTFQRDDYMLALSGEECPEKRPPVFDKSLDLRAFAKICEYIEFLMTLPDVDCLISPLCGKDSQSLYSHGTIITDHRSNFLHYMNHFLLTFKNFDFRILLIWLISFPGFADFINMAHNGRFYLSQIDAFNHARRSIMRITLGDEEFDMD